jgi:hypothetical protein
MMKRYLIALLLLFPTLSLADPVPVSIEVFGANEDAAKQLKHSLEDNIKAYSEVQVRNDKYPYMQLCVALQQDINDRKNPNGWSLAIVHLSNIDTVHVAEQLAKSSDPKVKKVMPDIANMIREQGFVRYINVAHIDEFSKENIDIVVSGIIGEFVKRVSNN